MRRSSLKCDKIRCDVAFLKTIANSKKNVNLIDRLEQKLKFSNFNSAEVS